MNCSTHSTSVTDLEELGMCRLRKSDTPKVMFSSEAISLKLARIPPISDGNRSEHIGQTRGFLGGISVTNH